MPDYIIRYDIVASISIRAESTEEAEAQAETIDNLSSEWSFIIESADITEIKEE